MMGNQKDKGSRQGKAQEAITGGWIARKWKETVAENMHGEFRQKLQKREALEEALTRKFHMTFRLGRSDVDHIQSYLKKGRGGLRKGDRREKEGPNRLKMRGAGKVMGETRKYFIAVDNFSTN